eukprot:SAG22_NODE_12349_length_446_cov_0.596542_1_plen_59_part_00
MPPARAGRPELAAGAAAAAGRLPSLLPPLPPLPPHLLLLSVTAALSRAAVSSTATVPE